MKIKIIPILLILSLLCGCGLASDEEQMTTGTSASMATSETVVIPDEVPQGSNVYEKYLAALSSDVLLQCIGGFRLDGIYAASFVNMENRMESKGVYIRFFANLENKIAHLYPIEAERTEPGSCNIYTPEVGYVAFELVSTMPKGVRGMDRTYYATVINKISAPAITKY